MKCTSRHGVAGEKGVPAHPTCPIVIRRPALKKRSDASNHDESTDGKRANPCRGCRVECAPGRNAKRRAVVCQDRHPCARAADIDCALGAGPGGHPLPFVESK
jgi:hypothetical protein